MVQFIIETDWLTTQEFCDKYGVPHPYWTGDVKTSAYAFLRRDLVAKRLFVDYAKFLSRKLTPDMFVGDSPIFLGFESSHVIGFYPKIKMKGDKYVITNDKYGLFLEPYDSVDGRRIQKVEDLSGLSGIDFDGHKARVFY